jgi:hypothetical protein
MKYKIEISLVVCLIVVVFGVISASLIITKRAESKLQAEYTQGWLDGIEAATYVIWHPGSSTSNIMDRFYKYSPDYKKPVNEEIFDNDHAMGKIQR